MKNLLRIHGKILAIEVVGAIAIIGNYFLLAKYLGIVLPPWILALLIMMLPLISAVIKIHTWRVRNDLLTDEELQRTGTTIFFLTIPVEIVFSLYVIISVLTQS